MSNGSFPARSRAPRWVLALVCCLAGQAGASGFCDGQTQDGSTTPHGGYCHQVRQMPPPQRPGAAPSADVPIATLSEDCVKPLQMLDLRFRVDAAQDDAERVGSVLEFLQLSIALQPTGEPPGTSWSAPLAALDGESGLAATQGRHLLSLSLQRPAPPAAAYVEADLDESWPSPSGGDPSFDHLGSARLELPAQAGWLHAQVSPSGDWSGLVGSLSFEPDVGSGGGSIRLPRSFAGIGLQAVVAWPYRLRSGLLGGNALHGGARTELNYFSLGNLDSACLWQ